MRDALAVTDRVSWFSLPARAAVRLFSSAGRSARFTRFATDSAVQCLVIPSPPRMFAPSVAGAGIRISAAPLRMRYLVLDFSQEIIDDDDVV